jgi:hypothetical protein
VVLQLTLEPLQLGLTLQGYRWKKGWQEAKQMAGGQPVQAGFCCCCYFEVLNLTLHHR